MHFMQAVQLLAHGTPGQFRFDHMPDPIPGPDEVVLEVHACGVNHLDLWAEAGGLPAPIRLPRIPGCEVAGTVLSLGPNVTAWSAGDRVAVQSNLFCGRCEFCRRGEESICVQGQLLGVDRDGGFAERVLVPAASLVRLPDQVEFVASAALTLAGSTAMHMLTDRATIQAGDLVLVIGGASGVGSAAIQIARHLGARVITTGTTPAKRELGLRLGAEQAIDPGQVHWAVEVRRWAGRRGVDLVIEHVGGPVLRQCFEALARGGTVVTCGATAGREVTLNLWPMFVKQQRLVGSYGRTRKDMEATLRGVAEGWLQPVIDRLHPLVEVPIALRDLRGRGVLGKRIICPRPPPP